MLNQISLPVKPLLDEVESVLNDCVRSNIPLATEAARYTIQNGGKRIRPIIFLLSASLSGARPQNLPSIAASLELMHTASLMHDDVVDDAMLRRGKPSARSKWGNRIGVLVGDFLWCCATSLFLENASSRMHGVITEALTETTEGELLEITRHNDFGLERDTYLKIIGGKTAALFSACGRCGAIAGELQERFEDALGEYALNVGMAFQLTDDVLDYTSCEKSLGKPVGSDFREGKLTLPLIVALANSDDEEARFIKNAHIAESVGDDVIRQIAVIVENRGGISAARELAYRYVSKAKASLAVFRSSIERDALSALADYVGRRSQ